MHSKNSLLESIFYYINVIDETVWKGWNAINKNETHEMDYINFECLNKTILVIFWS